MQGCLKSHVPFVCLLILPNKVILVLDPLVPLLVFHLDPLEIYFLQTVVHLVSLAALMTLPVVSAVD